MAVGELLLICGCGRPRPGERVVIKGSGTMVGLGQRWAEASVKAHPHILASVTGGGSGTGIAALVEGTCDIAQALREIKKDELEKAAAVGRHCVETVVAWAGVAVIVNPANPVSRVTLEQLSELFQGKITNWREIMGHDAPVVLLARETSSGTHAFFKKRVLQLNGKRKGADYAAAAILSTSSQAIHDEVASNPYAVGYVGLAYIEEDVKALAVAETPDGPFVPLTVGTVMNRAYPISRPLYVYTGGEPEGATKQFLEFALSPAGQFLVTDMGFVPVPKYSAQRAETPRPE